MKNQLLTLKEREIIISAFNTVKHEIMQEYEREKDEDFRWATGLKHSISIIDNYMKL